MPHTQPSSSDAREHPSKRYTKYELIGQGAQKKVYRAFDEERGMEVAWNEVAVAELARFRDKDRQRVFAEIRVLKQLKHKNIMTLHEYWFDESRFMLIFITEIFPDGSLRQYRRRHKNADLPAMKRWAWQILQGLVYLHGHNPPIIHRDLKCDNIFVSGSSGVVKIGDLGLVTLCKDFSAPQSVLGTPEFMAPELYEEKYDEKVDVYAFGMCLLELATMEYPYAECKNAAQIYKKVTQGIPPASVEKLASAELRDFITLCLSHDTSKRPEARGLLKHPFFESCRAAATAATTASNISCANGGNGGGPRLTMSPSMGSLLNAGNDAAAAAAAQAGGLSRTVSGAIPTPADLSREPSARVSFGGGGSCSDLIAAAAGGVGSSSGGGLSGAIAAAAGGSRPYSRSSSSGSGLGAASGGNGGGGTGGDATAAAMGAIAAALARQTSLPSGAGIRSGAASSGGGASPVERTLGTPAGGGLGAAAAAASPGPPLGGIAAALRSSLYGAVPVPPPLTGKLAEVFAAVAPSPATSSGGAALGSIAASLSPPMASYAGTYMAAVTAAAASASAGVGVNGVSPPSRTSSVSSAAGSLPGVGGSPASALTAAVGHQRQVASSPGGGIAQGLAAHAAAAEASAAAAAATAAAHAAAAAADSHAAGLAAGMGALPAIIEDQEMNEDTMFGEHGNRHLVVEDDDSDEEGGGGPGSQRCHDGAAAGPAAAAAAGSGGGGGGGADSGRSQPVRMQVRTSGQTAVCDMALSFAMSFTNDRGVRKKVGFQYDLQHDTASAIAVEMVENLSLNTKEAEAIAAMIQHEVSRFGRENNLQQQQQQH